jgi:UDPglucose 6-dehydrogenase
MNICIIGTGYVGLVSGVCFSDFGHNVSCVDLDQKKIDDLNQGLIPIFEPGLEQLLKRNFKENRLSFTTNLDSVVNTADVIFIAVGTPARRGDGHADIEYVVEAAKQIARKITKYIVIVIKSTVPVGTNRLIHKIIAEENPVLDFDVVSNPEFLREGAAIDDFMRPDRVIIGVESKKAEDILREIYLPLSLKNFPVIATDLESAELIKYASNAFLATKITFMNEIAALCEKVGGNISEIANGMGLDRRIGNQFLRAGPGYGGSCFPKDTLALAKIGLDAGSPISIIETVIKANAETKIRMLRKLKALCDNSFRGKKIAILGVTFKPETDDMREAPSLTIVPALLSEGANVSIYCPQGFKEGKELLGNVEWCNEPYNAVQNSNLMVILTEWNEFRSLDLQKLALSMETPKLADLRNIYSRALALQAGFESYDGVGK